MRVIVRVYEDAIGILAMVYDRSGRVKNIVSGLEKLEPGLNSHFMEELMAGLPTSPKYKGIPFPMEWVETAAVNSCELIAEVKEVKVSDGMEAPRLTIYPDAMGKHGERLFGIVRRHEASACAVINFQKAVNQ